MEIRPLPTNQDELESMSDFFAMAALMSIVHLAGGEFDLEDQRKPKWLGLEFQWVYGWDMASFETFVSHVGRWAVLISE